MELSALRAQTLPISWRSLDLAGHTRIPRLQCRASIVHDVGAPPFIGGAHPFRVIVHSSTPSRVQRHSSFPLGTSPVSTPVPVRRRNGGLSGRLMVFFLTFASVICGFGRPPLTLVDIPRHRASFAAASAGQDLCCCVIVPNTLVQCAISAPVPLCDQKVYVFRPRSSVLTRSPC